jgi:hypothetical protein
MICQFPPVMTIELRELGWQPLVDAGLSRLLSVAVLKATVGYAAARDGRSRLRQPMYWTSSSSSMPNWSRTLCFNSAIISRTSWAVPSPSL